MMEFVRVQYPDSRDVFIDGQKNGTTNQIIIVESGDYTFDLGPEKDYKPKKAIRRVSGTTSMRPEEIVFEPLSGSSK